MNKNDSIPYQVEHVVIDDEKGRLDTILSQKTDHSRATIQRLIKAGLITLESTSPSPPLKGKDLVQPSACYTIRIPPPAPAPFTEEDVEFDLVFEDDDIAIVNKPAGLVVHPAPGHTSGTLVHGLLKRLSNLSGIGGVERPGLVHRLDKGTSGLMVIAKNDTAHQNLAQQFQRHTLGRLYQMLIWGIPKPLSGVIDAPVGRHPRQRQKQAVTGSGKPARTHYKTVSLLEDKLSYVLCRLETGRTHQIRVHMAHIGYSLLGDAIYGRTSLPALRKELTLRLWPHATPALHAGGLYLTHPRTQEALFFHAPLPKTWAHLSMLDPISLKAQKAFLV